MITDLAFLQCCTNQQIDNAFKKIFYAETIRFGTLKLVKKLAKKKRHRRNQIFNKQTPALFKIHDSTPKEPWASTKF